MAAAVPSSLTNPENEKTTNTFVFSFFVYKTKLQSIATKPDVRMLIWGVNRLTR